MPKIIHDKNKCIGCQACVAVCSKFFQMDNEDGKTMLVFNGKKVKYNENNIAELEVDKLDCAEEAQAVCPTGAIKIEK